MASPSPASPRSRFARAYRAADEEDAANRYFAPQPTSTSDLPDPDVFLRNIARGVMEVFAGVRDVDQLARWLAEDAYRKLVTRSNLAARARSARGQAPQRPVHTIIAVHHSSPRDGVVEGVVVVRGPARTRAIAMRLEGTDGRWRTTSLALL
ncbi:hypothetical protein GCM10009808_02990 [Microbacterium sediminicola]|uniref:3-hydroxyacyl-CoA dehydrogenase n=1 Tax=Microbacterium sediminicola TaxID=415210 RepID=A0ABN2HKL3_9MICO